MNYGALGAGVLLGAGAVYELSMLRLPKEERERVCRWGRTGKGPPLSVFSIVGWSGLLLGIGTLAIYQELGPIGMTPAVVTSSEVGFCILAACAIAGVFVDARKRMPNKAPEPTPGKCPPSNQSLPPGAAHL